MSISIIRTPVYMGKSLIKDNCKLFLRNVNVYIASIIFLILIFTSMFSERYYIYC